jgi:hypothetical protein
VTAVTSLPADPALPQLASLLDAGLIRDVLARSIDSDLQGPEVEIGYLRYRPTRSLVVVYDVRLGERTHGVFALADSKADLAARAAAPDSKALAAKLAGRTPVDTPVAYLPELNALVHWLPLDLTLPAMAEPPERLRELLVAAGLELDIDDVPRPVKHKPMTRGVFRLDNHFAKVFPDRNSYDGSVQALDLSATLPFPTARCTAVVPELMIAVQSRVAGQRPGDASEIAPQAGALLAVLHATPFPDLPVELPTDHLESAARQVRLLTTITPGLAPRLAAFMERLRDAVPTDRLVSSHGGFHISQLLMSDGELAVVDFDGMCQAPAADDVASYVASLVEHADDLQRAAETLDVLVDAYGHRPAGVHWYLAAHLLGRARRPFTRLQPGWPDKVEQRVAAAEAALEL